MWKNQSIMLKKGKLCRNLNSYKTVPKGILSHYNSCIVLVTQNRTISLVSYVTSFFTKLIDEMKENTKFMYQYILNFFQIFL